jgi:NAD(P)H-hydrate epimerase
MAQISVEVLSDLIRKTGHAHHEAFVSSNAVHPEWPEWYAGYLQARLWDRLGRIITRSELTYLIVGADKAFNAAGKPGEWPDFYARYILDNFS